MGLIVKEKKNFMDIFYYLYLKSVNISSILFSMVIFAQHAVND